MPNRLIHEQSPYLLQHAHNPVDWYPWSDDAFERAKNEHKPVIVSIGYAACHWCHVMEHESFESEEVAAYMNEHFICIKVDREEHPDVDHMYMDAVTAINGNGGWPLNVFATPERIPFYGGTYYPPRPAHNRPSWMQLLQRMNGIWTNQNDEVRAQSDQMVQYLQNASKIATAKSPDALTTNSFTIIAEQLLRNADSVYGGFGRAPKFPGTMAISFLLEHYHFTNYEPSLNQALLSLDKMIEGGIYDQLGGGFARYSTDEKWLAPHFEKMLYDNALLILSLCDAYSITKKETYKKIIEETIAFAERELREPTGGFYSALDADSEGVEGKFYTWTYEEWTKIAGENNEALEAYFGIEPEGNWEETNILHIAKPVEEIAEKFGLTTKDLQAKIDELKVLLWDEREKRIRPITDDKSLLSWNALMNLALIKAGVVLQNEKYKWRAAQHAEWMISHFKTEKGLMHTWKNGVARINANLDDYAYLIQSMLQLAAAVQDNKWILLANELMEATIAQFKEEDGPFFYYTSSAQKDIPVRKIDVYDGATPSANAVHIHNLQLLSMAMERTEWEKVSTEMLTSMAATIKSYPYSFSYWLLLLQRTTAGCKLVVCTGANAPSNTQQLQESFLPTAYFLTSEKEISEVPALKSKNLSGETLIFVCTQEACLPPVHLVATALRHI